MPLDDLTLTTLIDDTEACIDRLRADGAAADSNLLQQLQETYACLVELGVWRGMFPQTRIAPLYRTKYGVLGVQ